MAGRRKLTAWVWRYVSRFAPTINDKNVLCQVKATDGTACKHLMKWSPRDSNKKGTGTTGLANHIKKRHPTQYKETMEFICTKEERNAPVPRQSVRRVVMTKNCNIKTQKTKNIRKTLHANILTF